MTDMIEKIAAFLFIGLTFFVLFKVRSCNQELITTENQIKAICSIKCEPYDPITMSDGQCVCDATRIYRK